MDIFHSEGAALLVRAILALETEEECRTFLEDLMTVLDRLAAKD